MWCPNIFWGICVQILFGVAVLGLLCWAVVSSTFVITAGFLICMSLGVDGFNKIDFLYMMAGFKLVLTIGHYFPQLLLNFRRKSTRGKCSKKNIVP